MNFRELFSGSDMRSPKGAAEAADFVLKNPPSIIDLIRLVESEDKVFRMRSSDALEKISATAPELLKPYTNNFIEITKRATQKEVRWHMVQILPRLQLNIKQIEEIVPILGLYFDDKSKIVVTFTIDALYQFSKNNDKAKDLFNHMAQTLSETGSPAVKARLRKLQT